MMRRAVRAEKELRAARCHRAQQAVCLAGDQLRRLGGFLERRAEIAGHGRIADLVEDIDVSGVKRRSDILITAPTRF